MKGKAEEQVYSLKAELTANSTTCATSNGIIYNVKVPGIHDGGGEEFFHLVEERKVKKSNLP